MTPADLANQLRSTGTLTLTLKVIPKSSRNELVGLMEDGSLKVKITAAPEKGKANAAVCGFLAEFFGVAKKNVEIVRGETSQSKQVMVRI
ncbi:MAG TPA: DUF167 domain-containing protein [Bryobacteraceae bacterium]|nr:DUF167 domain-containing protein [Bryobacteraceae bacterium]